MTDVLALVQTTLDSLLSVDDVRVFWGRRGDNSTGSQIEYAIYSLEGDPVSVSADGSIVARTASVSVNYYYEQNACRKAAGRQQSTERMTSILTAMKAAGFLCSGGWSEVGDVDDAGFVTFNAMFDYVHLESV